MLPLEPFQSGGRGLEFPVRTGGITVQGRGPLGGATFELDLPGRPFDPAAPVTPIENK